jgi:nitroimidazol reductase NimA-like FMN-containing flavoprotein (pyridoxamine 5'-phosphate oxidase superfamily)
MVRQMEAGEVSALLELDTVAHLATLDDDGFPHVTPIWFIWHDGAFYFASDTNRPHVARLRRDARAGVVVDIEAARRSDGERPNQHVRAVGRAVAEPDVEGRWTARIWEKYGGDPAETADRLAGRRRSVIRLVPESMVTVASV